LVKPEEINLKKVSVTTSLTDFLVTSGTVYKEDLYIVEAEGQDVLS